MTIETFLAIYFVVWWIVLFAVLPWGMRTQEEEGEVTPGTPASAPANLNLAKKAMWTTIVSAIILFLFGTGPVKGFAVTLSFGLFANLFTAVFVSRHIFDSILKRKQRGEALSIG